MHDRQTAQQIQDQTPGAWAAFVDTYGPRLHRLARRYAPCEADAEDLTQEVFVALYQSMAGFRGESSLATWAYRIALNHCLKLAAKNRLLTVPYDDARETPAPHSHGPAAQSANRELSSEIDTALSHLSPSHRDAVILHELHEMTYAECAAVLGVPVGTVKSRLSTAFRRLRESLGAYVLSDTLPESAPMTNCTPYQNDLKAYADGELSPLRRFLVRRHLTHCASCREEISAMTQLTEDLRAAEPADTLSPSLREKLLTEFGIGNAGLPGESHSVTEDSSAAGSLVSKTLSRKSSPALPVPGLFRRLPAWSYAALVIVAWFVCYPLLNAMKYQKQAQITSTTADRARMQSERTARAVSASQTRLPEDSPFSGTVPMPASAPPPPKSVAVAGLPDRRAGTGDRVVYNGFGIEKLNATSIDGNANALNADPDSLRQVHKEAGIGIQVPNPEATGDKLNAMVGETGGYVAANNLSTDTDGLKSGELIVKVPEAQFETFLASVAKLGTVVSKNVTGQDITDKTSDANQAQVVQESDLEKAEARLKALGSHAKWEDQENTRDLRIQLAQTRARLKLLKRMAALGTITIDLSQTPKAAAAVPITGGFLGTLQATTHDALQSLVGSASALLALVIWLLAYSPIWVPLLLLARYARKEYKKREATPSQ